MKKGSMLPKHYATVMSRHPKLNRALQVLGKALREEGPLDEKTAQLIQLAAAAGIRSEGSVHSHVRRALGSRGQPRGDLPHPFASHQHHRLSHNLRRLELGV